jgi:hypothetical protein
MQEVRRFKPPTVSRRFSVTAGFYRTAVIDGILQCSPAEHVRRPTVPAESEHPGIGRFNTEDTGSVDSNRAANGHQQRPAAHMITKCG